MSLNGVRAFLFSSDRNGTARLRAYVAGDCYEGLMTADGHRVTMPLYADMALCGMDPIIPYHEMLQAVRRHQLIVWRIEIFSLPLRRKIETLTP